MTSGTSLNQASLRRNGRSELEQFESKIISLHTTRGKRKKRKKRKKKIANGLMIAPYCWGGAFV
jgi:DNA invertase Pin-like site-specific DNA recombinase